ncbi:DUF397 domain-containing protein [Kribbella sp. NPDC055110]
MIAPAGRLPLDYVRHFAPGADRLRGQLAAPKPVSGQGRPVRPEPARRSTSGIGRDPGQGPAAPAPGEPSGHGTRAAERIPAAAWRRSRYSTDPGDCLEYAVLPGGGAALRHSRQPDVVLTYTKGEWEAFVAGVGEGEFNPAALAFAAGQPGQVAP